MREAPRRSGLRVRPRPLANRRGVFVRERPLGRLEDRGQRDRLLPLLYLLAAVDVEDAQIVQLGSGRASCP